MKSNILNLPSYIKIKINNDNELYIFAYISNYLLGSIEINNNYEYLEDLEIYGIDYLKENISWEKTSKDIEEYEMLFSENKYIEIFKTIINNEDKLKDEYKYDEWAIDYNIENGEVLILDIILNHLKELIKNF